MIFLPASGAEVLLAGVVPVAPAALLVPLLLLVGAAAELELELEFELPHPAATAAVAAIRATTLNTRLACHALLTVTLLT
jgi:hypothetical protein